MDYVTLRNRAEDYDMNILRMICKSNAHSPLFLLGSNLAANCCLLISSFNAVSCHGHSAISTSSVATPPSSVAAAAAKSVQSCPTLCDPIDGSPPGSPVLGILKARTLEWVAISFSNEWKWKVKVKSLSRIRLLATPWTAAYQAPPSLGFSRQEYWSGVPLPSPHLLLATLNFSWRAKLPLLSGLVVQLGLTPCFRGRTGDTEPASQEHHTLLTTW